ncbi:hypothetical protein, partial [Profundibacterium mesophilum]
GSILMAHWQNYLWDVMKSSPYWPQLAGRFELVPSGWKQIFFWTENHVRETVEGKYMTLNLYNGDNWE